MEIILASLPDREQVVAELWLEDKQVAEINRESGEFVIEIYRNPIGGPWRFDLDDFVSSIDAAKQKLLIGS